MDIIQTISANLAQWMKDSPRLGTLEEVAKASGVGFGTVRRIKNGQVNPTINNLEAIAKAFRRTARDLLVPLDAPYGTADCTKLAVNESDGARPESLRTHPVFNTVSQMTPAQLDTLASLIVLVSTWQGDGRTGNTRVRTGSRVRTITQPTDEIERQKS